jgi:hypothetical protein
VGADVHHLLTACGTQRVEVRPRRTGGRSTSKAVGRRATSTREAAGAREPRRHSERSARCEERGATRYTHTHPHPAISTPELVQLTTVGKAARATLPKHKQGQEGRGKQFKSTWLRLIFGNQLPGERLCCEQVSIFSQAHAQLNSAPPQQRTARQALPAHADVSTPTLAAA